MTDTAPTFEVIVGDCRDVMRTMDAQSVDAIVTDPPYGLEFMGKGWDRGVPGVEFWSEASRVLKPGGNLLAFGGTRTFHRLTCAIEDAGFEIRDCLSWLYGSGFPKSLDVSKAIDKARVEDLEPTRRICRAIRSSMDARGLRSRDLVDHFGGCNARLIDHWAARDTDSQPFLPTSSQWSVLVSLFPELACIDEEFARLNGRKGTRGDAWIGAKIVGVHEGSRPGLAGKRFTAMDDLIREPSDQATNWSGWGTALKPAWEPIILARKPLAGTVAANVLEHGCGALNVDGCRIHGTPWTFTHTDKTGRTSGILGEPRAREGVAESHPSGRWPANVVLDDDAAALLDAQTGALKSGSMSAGTVRGVGGNAYHAMKDTAVLRSAIRGSVGGASRFFFTGKATRAERKAFNQHPTVKPVSVMRWLVRLVTPPGGMVLDPFTGSGTTGVACRWEGFSFVGVEQSEDYAKIARARIDHEEPEVEEDRPVVRQRELFT